MLRQLQAELTSVDGYLVRSVGVPRGVVWTLVVLSVVARLAFALAEDEGMTVAPSEQVETVVTGKTG